MAVPDAPQLRQVYLRRPAAADCKEFTALNRVSIALHRGLVSPPRTPRQFAKYLDRNRQKNNALFLVCRRGDDAIVGAINFTNIILGSFRNAFLGYFFCAPQSGG